MSQEPQNFKGATALLVQNVRNTRVFVEPYEGEGITVTITGPQDAMDAISITQQGVTCVIEPVKKNDHDLLDTLLKTTLATFAESLNSGKMIIGTKMPIVGNAVGDTSNVFDDQSLKITVQAPCETPLAFSGNRMSISIGEMHSPVHMKQLRYSNVVAKSVAVCNISIAWGANVHIEQVQGNMTVEVKENGILLIDRALIDNLTITTMEKAEVEISGRVTKARVITMDWSNLFVESIVERPVKSILGIGRVILGNWVS